MTDDLLESQARSARCPVYKKRNTDARQKKKIKAPPRDFISCIFKLDKSIPEPITQQNR